MVGMRKTILKIVAVALVGCGTTSKEIPTSTSWVSDPSDPNNVKIEAAIRKELKKPTGELTKVDLEKVKELNLKRIILGMKVPKGLEKLTKLERLYLGPNQLTNVKGLEKLTKLRDLYLYHNQLTSVKDLKKLTKLERLYLQYNQLTEVQGLENLTQLWRLNLSNNKLTNVKGLEKLMQLKELALFGNPKLTKAQIEELKKTLPKCEIYWPTDGVIFRN